MRRVVVSLFFLFGAVSVAAAARPQSQCLVTIFEDSMGHLMKTREVIVFRSGEVTEETYNFTSDESQPVHRKRRLKTLGRRQLTRIQSLLADNGFEKLPSVIDLSEGIIPDAPFRMIRAYSGNGEHSVEWNNFSEDPKTNEAVRFTAVFREVTRLAAPAP